MPDASTGLGDAEGGAESASLQALNQPAVRAKLALSSNVAEVVGMWAAEASDYNHPTNTCSGICGHYTQIVWAATQHLGCGYRQCDGGGEIWVCNYDPRGNYYGQSPY